MNLHKKISIFLVDADFKYSTFLKAGLNDRGEYDIHIFSNGEACLESLDENADLLLLDYDLDTVGNDGLPGLQILERVKAAQPEIPVIILSSQDKLDTALSCLRLNVFAYIVKNETAIPRLQNAINTILRYRKMEKTLSWYMEKV